VFGLHGLPVPYPVWDEAASITSIARLRSTPQW
jgi:hypothetical protein